MRRRHCHRLELALPWGSWEGRLSSARSEARPWPEGSMAPCAPRAKYLGDGSDPATHSSSTSTFLRRRCDVKRQRGCVWSVENSRCDGYERPLACHCHGRRALDSEGGNVLESKGGNVLESEGGNEWRLRWEHEREGCWTGRVWGDDHLPVERRVDAELGRRPEAVHLVAWGRREVGEAPAAPAWGANARVK